MTDYITSSLIVLGIIGFYKFCEKVFPSNRSEYTSNKNQATLKTLYVGHDLNNQGIFLLSAVVAGFMIYKLLPWLLDLRLSFVTDQVIMVKHTESMSLLIAVFSGMLIAIPVSFFIAKRKLKADWPEYLAYQNLKYRFNYMKATKYTTWALTVIVAFLLVLFFGWYSAFGNQEIKINGALSLSSKIYRYSDITKAKELESLYAPNGNIVNDPHFVIEFNDGQKWNSRESGFDNFDQDKQIIELIRSKTNLELIKQEFDN
jgi:hypothetical protein